MQVDIDFYLSSFILTACATGGMSRALGIRLHRGTFSFTRMSRFGKATWSHLGAIYNHDPRKFTSNMHNRITDMVSSKLFVLRL